MRNSNNYFFLVKYELFTARLLTTVNTPIPVKQVLNLSQTLTNLFRYYLLADYDDYIKSQDKVNAAYLVSFIKIPWT